VAFASSELRAREELRGCCGDAYEKVNRFERRLSRRNPLRGGRPRRRPLI
jgi:hypothetical protein